MPSGPHRPPGDRRARCAVVGQRRGVGGLRRLLRDRGDPAGDPAAFAPPRFYASFYTLCQLPLTAAVLTAIIIGSGVALFFLLGPGLR
ncbi:hypothetical protein SCATT_06370 [Streptantibioticus cattleyicolor NRRL 8057 = DSM 46488]|uniref:Uncharacterized protein n=1 Tax=Streptantibioticus cattleyicolor (strain ATCC 35852 / DSM 46488 / JCM 4925 / NBRC 14057 / NRRL 8057) TaxID=1003195 RepID=G8WTC5_STREN|nr:hypothetical protein SCATT_06370 [Streptantibioticus cattleyicolor NRRL 8057 = DSM 46488]